MTDQKPINNKEQSKKEKKKNKLLNNPLAEKVLKLEQELKNSQAKAEEMTTTAQRALADLQNFKRRTEEERSRFAQFASAELVRELIPHLDNFQRAFEHAPESNEWADSIKIIYEKLLKSLESQGLKRIEALNQQFDPNLHEALLQGPGKKDIVIEELESGYLLGEQVIKPSRVKVGNGEKE